MRTDTMKYLVDVNRVQTFEIEAENEDDARTYALDGKLIDDCILGITVVSDEGIFRYLPDGSEI